MKENNSDALEAIDNELTLFRSANGAPNGHVLLMEEDSNEIEKNSEYQKWVVQQKFF